MTNAKNMSSAQISQHRAAAGRKARRLVLLSIGVLGTAGLLTTAPALAAQPEPSPAALHAPCGGPYRVDNQAVWYNCGSSSVQLCVRQVFPYKNYRVMVVANGEHRSPWWRTIDISTSMYRCR